MSLIPFAPFCCCATVDFNSIPAASCEQAWRIGRCRYDNLFFDDMTANKEASVSRVADCEQLSLLLDKARQFAGEYIDSLEGYATRVSPSK
jgi:hypothetical protein